MKKVTINVKTPWEAIRPYIANEELRAEYMEESEFFRNMDLEDDVSIMDFLDNDAEGVRRLEQHECIFFKLPLADWYIDLEDYIDN